MIQEALGTYDVTATDTQAITYAEDHGVPVVASSADEESEHHNLPAVLENTIVVNSVTHDSSYTPPSYLYLNGCTNYGANISVSVESSSCSSEATGKTGRYRRPRRISGSRGHWPTTSSRLPRTAHGLGRTRAPCRPTRSPNW